MWFAVLALAAVAQALPQRGGGGRSSLLRFGCSQVVIESLDPLVNQGQNPSPHLHQVVGGNAFNTTMPSTDISKLATCTSCTFSDDFSNYWTANMYFKAKNGSFRRVPQVPNKLLSGESGGVTVYYTSPGANQVTAFKPGFRMLFGDASVREKKGSGFKSQSCFRCYTGPNYGGDNASPCADPRLDTEAFPSKPCLGGIRSNIHFPTCWDGVNLDSPNHKDHVAYPTAGPASFDPQSFTCPSSHPVKIPQVMLEIVWDTTPFNDDKSLWDGGKQPLYLSMGDNSGFGQHADYVFGWKGDALQKAMDGGCFGPSCAGLKTQTLAEGNKCTVKSVVSESVEGWLSKLPGDGSGV